MLTYTQKIIILSACIGVLLLVIVVAVFLTSQTGTIFPGSQSGGDMASDSKVEILNSYANKEPLVSEGDALAICFNEQLTADSYRCVTDFAITFGNTGICENLKDQIEACQKEVEYTLAVEGQIPDIQNCADGLTKEYPVCIDSDQQLYRYFQDNSSVEVCSEAADNYVLTCVSYFISQNRAVEDCDIISNEYLKSACINYYDSLVDFDSAFEKKCGNVSPEECFGIQ